MSQCSSRWWTLIWVLKRWRRAMGGEEGEDLRFWEVEAEGFEGDFEFVVIYSAVFV